MRSKIYSSDYMKSMTKGQLWIPIFFSFGFLMAFVVTELLMFGNWLGAQNLTADDIRILYEELWQDGFLFTGFVVIACGAVVNGVQSFWYLYSSRKTDFYHSLPVKRSGLFWQRTFIGILYYLVPYVIMVFLAVCIGALRGFFSLNIVGLAILMLLLHFILYLLFYFSAVLVICVTGNILMGTLCLGGLMLYGRALEELLQGYRMIFYTTSYNTESYGLLKFLEEYASPYSLGINLLEQYSGKNFWGMLVIVICVAAVFGVLSYLAFVNRPSESAGKPLAYGWIGVILKFMVVVPCGLGIGLIFFMLPYYDSGNGWWIFGMVLGTVLSHGMLEVVYQMDFQKFFSKKHHLVIAGILVAVCAANYKLDLLKFNAYLPAQEKLAAINFDLSSQIGQNNDLIIRQKDGKYQKIGSWSCEEAALTGEHGVGEQTWQVLKQIVDQQTRRETEAYRSGGGYIPLKYTLKSGREIYRRYWLAPQELYDLYRVLYEEGSLKEKKTSFFQIEQKYLESIDGSFVSGENYRLFQEEPEKCQELLEALRADMEEAEAEEFLEEPCAFLDLFYHFPENDQDLMDPKTEGNFVWLNRQFISVDVYPAFQRTVAILEKAGYPMSMDDVSLEKAEITYIKEENDADVSTTICYEDEEELREIKEALVPASLVCGWNVFENDLYVEYYLSGNSGQYSQTGYLLSEKVPDFVKEMKKEQLETE